MLRTLLQRHIFSAPNFMYGCFKKRKRTQNTTSAQYLLHKETLENDYVLRSGTIDPTVEPEYIDKQWNLLTSKLNAIGNGPALSEESWQKRFKDWKNATRSKYRKVVECRNATGGGSSEIKTEMTPLEKRGLNVWWKVSVTGTPLVSITGGIRETPQKIHIKEAEDVVNGATFENSSHYSNEGSIVETKTIIPVGDVTNNNLINIETLENKDLPTQPNTDLPKIKKNVKSKKPCTSLNETAEELKISFDQNTEVLRYIGNILNNAVEAYKHRVRTEERKLSFEIQKYKYENTHFEFNDVNS